MRGCCQDGEAHLSAHIEVLCALLQLYEQLPSDEYAALLPVVFRCVNQLMCHSRHRRLRDALAAWTFRVAHLYGFASPDESRCPRASYD